MLEARDIRKAYAGVIALKSVSFDLKAGEVHALLGENGAGKSTLIKVITGAVEPDRGTLRIARERVVRNSPALARSLGIAAIYQQPSLFPHLSVAENIALALERGGLWKRISWKARRDTAATLLARAGSTIDPERPASSLSMPEQQIVEIAKAIGSEAKILIMDEPTASLTEREVEGLFQVIRALRAQGVGIVYITHRLEELSAIADRVTVLRDGRTVGSRTIRELDRATLIEMMAGRAVATLTPNRTVPIGDTALELRNVSSRAGVRDVSFAVRGGEILGLAGLVGSGRTQVAETIFGITPADSGEILLSGVSVKISSPAAAIAHGISYVPEDRRQHGVVLEMPIFANTSLANLKSVSRFGWLRGDQDRHLAASYIGQLRIKAPSPEIEAGSLSGGNQQKVALARWLATHPKVLILDEPTQGVDVASKAEIHELVMDLAAQGIAIVMISSEMPELLATCDRIAVMRTGRIAGVFARDEATPEAILSMALGHAATAAQG